MPKKNIPTVAAKDVPDFAGFFKKVGGEYVHVRISESSVRHLRLDESKVWGISILSGNVSKLEPDKQVILCSAADIQKNLQDTDDWEAQTGCKERSVKMG